MRTPGAADHVTCCLVPYWRDDAVQPAWAVELTAAPTSSAAAVATGWCAEPMLEIGDALAHEFVAHVPRRTTWHV